MTRTRASAKAAGSDLLTELREHDLPPSWDGHAVVWMGWSYPPAGFLCPPPRIEVCEGCGMPTTERGFPCWSINWGVRADYPTLTHADYQTEKEARGRLPDRVKHKPRRHWWRNLCAHRCHHCQLDSIWDTDTDEWWTLDHTDYSDTGSVSP